MNGLAQLGHPDRSGTWDWRGDKWWTAMTSVFSLKRLSLLQEKFYRNQGQRDQGARTGSLFMG